MPVYYQVLVRYFMKHLLLISDSESERVIELHNASSSIGRDPSNSIVLCADGVSRQHAILLRMTHPGEDEHSFRITDGNWRGKLSTNGLFVNGRRCTSHVLHHGDEIVFGSKSQGRYFTVGDDMDVSQLLEDDDDDAMADMLTLVNVPCAPASASAVEKLDYSVLARLASFPELFIHPIIEISLDGEITYRNPAAIDQFPEISIDKFEHPVLSGVIEFATTGETRQSVREIVIGDRTFEQSLSYIPQSDLIRSYLIEITDRKRAEDQLVTLHAQLESAFEKRTMQFNEATSRLKQEEQALMSSIATNRALLNAIPDPMFRIDGSGTVVNCKAQKHHTLPFDPHDCIGSHLSEILPEPEAQTIQDCIFRVLETDSLQILEFQMPTAELTLEFEARIAVSAPNEVMVILRDITERKRSEAEIRFALGRERELNEMKTRFVSMTSHEFRTPLTTISSSAELIERYRDRWDADKQVQYLRKIQISAKHMTSLLNDVLLINKAEAGMVQFVPQPVMLADFCQEIVEELQITTDRHTLTMSSQLSTSPVLIDRKLLRHILTNLLSNAINYSPSGGDIKILLNQEDDNIELCVKDSGIGIPQSSQATLFDSFVRGSNVGTISGTGLGLAIVNRSVDMHKGTITCDSEVGKGTAFTVTIPLKVPELEKVCGDATVSVSDDSRPHPPGPNALIS